MAKNFNKEIMDYIYNTKRCAESINDQKALIKTIVKIIKGSNRVFICGNGGSSSTASHMANDLQKMCGIKAICLSDNIPLLTAWANDTEYKRIFREQIAILGDTNDVLIIFSGSGDSDNLIEAINYAYDNGIISIAILGSDKGRIAKMEEPIKFIINSDMLHAEDWHLTLEHLICKLIST